MQNIKVKSTLIHALTPHQTQFKISKLIPERYILFIRRCLFGALELKKKKRWRKRAAGCYGMEEAKQCQQAAKRSL